MDTNNKIGPSSGGQNVNNSHKEGARVEQVSSGNKGPRVSAEVSLRVQLGKKMFQQRAASHGVLAQISWENLPAEGKEHLCFSEEIYRKFIESFDRLMENFPDVSSASKFKSFKTDIRAETKALGLSDNARSGFITFLDEAANSRRYTPQQKANILALYAAFWK